MSAACPRINIRTTGGRRIGFGHARRCLTLAEAIRQSGGEVRFAIDGDDDVVQLVRRAGFEAIRVADPDDVGELGRYLAETGCRRVVVDTYTVGSEYFRALRQAGYTVAAIDDLADRALPIDLVINGSAGAERLVYQGAPDTRYLLGPQFMLLRPAFALAVDREIREPVQRVLITVGGADPADLTWRLVRQTLEIVPAARLDVVIGPLFERTTPPADLLGAASTGRLVLHVNPPDMRALMLGADLVISGGGQTTYELAATGTPTIGLRLADNQYGNLEGLAAAGALIEGGDPREAGFDDDVCRAVRRLVGDRAARAALSEHGRRLVDGCGAERVARAIMELVEP